jgi:prophage regulatory protein
MRNNEPPALWRLDRVLAMTGLGRSTIYRRISTQDFPAPRDLGGGPVAWRSDEIMAWIESRPVAAGHNAGHETDKHSINAPIQ